MSNFIKPYEISVWDDIWDATKGKFIERRIATIGANNISSPTRAFEPQFNT
jgi:hypothetical protein